MPVATIDSPSSLDAERRIGWVVEDGYQSLVFQLAGLGVLGEHLVAGAEVFDGSRAVDRLHGSSRTEAGCAMVNPAVGCDGEYWDGLRLIVQRDLLDDGRFLRFVTRIGRFAVRVAEEVGQPFFPSRTLLALIAADRLDEDLPDISVRCVNISIIKIDRLHITRQLLVCTSSPPSATRASSDRWVSWSAGSITPKREPKPVEF